MQRQYSLEVADILKLVPWAANPRKHPKEQIEKLANSMREFGFTSAVTIDENNNILCGNGRVQAALTILTNSPTPEQPFTVPVLRVSGLTKAQKSALVIVDNKIGEEAEWDEQLLEITLESLADTDLELADLGLIDLTIPDIEELEEGKDTKYNFIVECAEPEELETLQVIFSTSKTKITAGAFIEHCSRSPL